MARQAADMVTQIANASTEQSQGIEQINQAAQTMERVTVKVAETATATAASSKEMTPHTETMAHAVQRLIRLAQGRKGLNGRKTAGQAGPAGPGPMGRAKLPPPSRG